MNVVAESRYGVALATIIAWALKVNGFIVLAHRKDAIEVHLGVVE